MRTERNSSEQLQSTTTLLNQLEFNNRHGRSERLHAFARDHAQEVRWWWWRWWSACSWRQLPVRVRGRLSTSVWQQCAATASWRPVGLHVSC
uniref:Uncharacterized protein n=1 Tax=Meloidogyne incognita TaxID=6306 RepID=A0A914NWS1_MELIC